MWVFTTVAAYRIFFVSTFNAPDPSKEKKGDKNSHFPPWVSFPLFFIPYKINFIIQHHTSVFKYNRPAAPAEETAKAAGSKNCLRLSACQNKPHRPTGIMHLQRSRAAGICEKFNPYRSNRFLIIYCAGVYRSGNTDQAASVEFGRHRRANYARSGLQSLVGNPQRDFPPESED